MVRSGGRPSSTVRIFQAEVLRDPDSDAVAPVNVGHSSAAGADSTVQ
jgi:hypothetical protein